MLAPLGRGISLRRAFLGELAERLTAGESQLRSQLDWVEVVPENFTGRGGKVRHALLQIAEILPVTLHGVALSIGSIDPLNFTYLGQLKTLARETRARWVTDHLCFSSVGGVQFHGLLPLPFTVATVRHVVDRIQRVQDYLGIPFGLENPSTYVILPGAEMSEAQFISEILERSDCLLLLDINNVYVNCFNHTENPIQSAYQFLKEIPLQRVVEVHVAGYKEIQLAGQMKLLDTHGAPVSEPVQNILLELHRKVQIQTLLLERENAVPPLDEITREVSSLWQMIWENPIQSIQRPPELQL